MLTDLINRGADINDSRKTWTIDRSRFLGSSELHMCIRRAWYDKHSPEVGEPQQWGFARRGHAVERWVIDQLVAVNTPLVYAGEEQVTLTDPDTRLSATPDGFIVDHDNHTAVGIEIKSIDPRTNRSNLPREAHIHQLQMSMALFQRSQPGTTVTHGVLLYVNASDFDDLAEHRVEIDPAIVPRFADRAKRVLDTRLVEMLDREGQRSRGKVDCKRCPYQTACLGAPLPRDQQGPVKGNRGSKLHRAVLEYVNVKSSKDAADATLSELKETIIADMQKRGVDKVVVDGNVVELRHTAGRKTLDKKLVAAAGIDLSAFEKQGRPFDTLTIKSIPQA